MGENLLQIVLCIACADPTLNSVENDSGSIHTRDSSIHTDDSSIYTLDSTLDTQPPPYIAPEKKKKY